MQSRYYRLLHPTPHCDRPKAASRAGSAADNESKRKALQKEYEKVKLGDEDLANLLHFKYLGVMQSGNGDPLVPVNRRVMTAWSLFRNLKRVLTEGRLSTTLRLRLFSAAGVSTILCGCEC